VALFSAMAQSGIPAPVGPESRLAVFDGFFADVGDEQSIEASLSTFSAHLRNLSEILRLATRDSLVLVDELGSGTDPQEGAALGEQLERREEDLRRRDAETQAILDDARERIQALARREKAVRERERAAEKQSRQDARRYLLDARQEIERTIKELRAKGSEE